METQSREYNDCSIGKQSLRIRTAFQSTEEGERELMTEGEGRVGEWLLNGGESERFHILRGTANNIQRRGVACLRVKEVKSKYIVMFLEDMPRRMLDSSSGAVLLSRLSYQRVATTLVNASNESTAASAMEASHDGFCIEPVDLGDGLRGRIDGIDSSNGVAEHTARNVGGKSVDRMSITKHSSVDDAVMLLSSYLSYNICLAHAWFIEDFWLTQVI